MKSWEIANYLIENRKACRVRRDKPCPVCGKPDWCLRMPDGTAALCTRADGVGAIKQYGEYGWLYIVSPGLLDNENRPRPGTSMKTRVTADEELDVRFRSQVESWAKQRSKVGELADVLGVTMASLVELTVGWDGNAWMFPERNAAGLIIGINRRFPNGRKICVDGSRRGLTYSPDWATRKGAALIVEGGSDTATGITLGLCVIGRPSNTGGLAILAKLLKSHTKRKVIVIGERDRKRHEDLKGIVREQHNPQCRCCASCWPGMHGAKSVAAGLRTALGRQVEARLMPDNAKDIRGWMNDRTDWEEARRELLRRLA